MARDAAIINVQEAAVEVAPLENGQSEEEEEEEGSPGGSEMRGDAGGLIPIEGQVFLFRLKYFISPGHATFLCRSWALPLVGSPTK